MNKLLSKTKEFIFAQQTSMISSTMIISGMIILSRIAGVVRDRVFTSYYAPNELDIFYASFRIPDLIFEILITGALSTTFIPFFIKYQKEGKEHDQIISSIINIITLALIVLVTLLSILMPFFIPILTPGFSVEKNTQITYFSQILLLGQLPFLVLGNFLTGMSQAKKSFLIPAIAPIVYTLTIIVATILFYHQFFLLAPIIGVVAGAILFFIFQIPVLFSTDFHYQPVISHVRTVWRFFRTALPRVFTIIISQIDATVDLTLATLLGNGAYTFFYFAQKLQLLPVSVIGVAFGQASLPFLTEMYENKKINEFKRIIEESILNMFYLTIPFAAFFIFARTPIVRLFFGGQKFDWDSTVLTAVTLSYFCIALPFHSIYYFVTRCFYAMFDTKTPFLISLFSVTINTILSLSMILIFHLPIWSMAVAFSTSMILSVCVLLYLLNKKVEGGFNTRMILVENTKIVAATLNASIITYGIQKLFDGLIFDTTRTINVFLLLLFCGIIYISIYLFLTWLFGIREMYVLTKMFLKVREYQRKVVELYKGVE